MASLIVAALQEQHRQQDERRRLEESMIGADAENGLEQRLSSSSDDVEAGTNNDGETTTNTNTTTGGEVDDELQQALDAWELRRRRQSFLFVVLFFILLRLWMQALISQDGGLLVISVMCSIWFTKVQEERRTEEETLLERVAAGQATAAEVGNHPLSIFFRNDDDEQQDSAVDGAPGTRQLRPVGGVGASTFTSDDLSFQMQLAIAMMESQRMMHAQMNNGMMPSSDQPSQLNGVPSNIQDQWKRFTIQQQEGGEGPTIVPLAQPATSQDTSSSNAAPSSRQPTLTAGDTGARLSRFHRAFMARRQRRQSQYASLDDITDLDLEAGNSNSNNNSNQTPLAECDHEHHGLEAAAASSGDKKSNEKSLLMDDLTSCSICLSEYEPNETMVQFPCGHIYHDECAKAWVERSIKCPLCNYTLDGTEDSDKPQASQ